LDRLDSDGCVPHERKVITPVTGVPGFENAGYGRIVRFEEPQKLGNLLSRVKEGLQLRDNYLSVAVPQAVLAGTKSAIPITSIGICAGSGGSMLNGLDVDMLFTGELSHHEALTAIEQGKVVVTAFHSNTERAFLRRRMGLRLESAIMDELRDHDVAIMSSTGVYISKADRDPFEIIDVGRHGW
jgi:putative NIF3 family GTP cyclohydrolase 1 type 2